MENICPCVVCCIKISVSAVCNQIREGFSLRDVDSQFLKSTSISIQLPDFHVGSIVGMQRGRNNLKAAVVVQIRHGITPDVSVGRLLQGIKRSINCGNL